jgi:hypothetical protein
MLDYHAIARREARREALRAYRDDIPAIVCVVISLAFMALTVRFAEPISVALGWQ